MEIAVTNGIELMDMKTGSVIWDQAIREVAVHDGSESSALSMDNDAFNGFYERTARPVWAYLARVSGNSALADDLLQETYLRFLGAKIPDGEVACRHYLFRIASNLLRDHWRRLEPVPLDQLSENTLIAPSNVNDSGMEARRTLASAFPRLRPRDRQLLWLAYAEGASHREIAEITGLRETSIRLLLFRAKRKLARFLRSYQPRRRHEP